MANLRTGDYKGFNYATSSQDGIGSGLMLWSGSMILNSAAAYTSYSGVGLELIGNSESYLRFATSTSTQTGEIDIRAQKFFVGTPTTQFISGSGGNIEISSSNFHLTPSGDITMSGTITADAGNIGAWKIIDGKLSGSNATLDAVGAALYHTTKGPGTDTAAAFDQVRDEYYIDFTPDEGPTATAGKYYVKFGPNFAVSESGQLFASGAVFEGTITASAGKIGGYNIGVNTLTTTGFEIGDSTQTYALSSSKFQVTHTGNITASAGKIGGWDITGTTLRAQSSVDSSQGILLAGGTGPSIRVGEIDGGLPSVQMFYSDNNNYGFRIADFDALAQSTSRMYLGKDSGNDRYEISGWSLGVNELTGGKMIIRKDGTIESSGFASDVPGSGFRLTAEDGGFLEVENAKIRGTLSTTTFEKESVNAVGGQLYVANATVLTGSGELGGSAAGAGIHRATDTTMSVINVSGFAINEILTMKKVSDTGFATEYVLVQSSSRNTPSSGTDLTGKLYVERGYSGSDTINPTTSGSLGDIASSAQSYSGSQVIVSTGKIGTGYIRLNANPNDVTTPFIDIVERTGSGIYDVDLKARLGDLSGLSSDRLHGTDPTGQFGLYSKNVFLEGGIVANTGSIGGIQMKNDKLYIGTGTHNNSNTAFYVDNTGNMSLKDKLVWDGSTLTISGQITIQAGSDLTAGLPAGVVSSSAQLPTGIVSGSAQLPGIAAAQSTANTATASANTAQAAIDAMESQLVLTNTGMDISSSGQSPNFGLAKFGTSTEFYDGSSAQNLKLKLNAGGVIAYGDDANTYAVVNSSGLTIVEDSANVANFGSTVRVGADATDKSALRVDGSGNLTIGTSNNSSISLDTSGNATFSGSLSASSATFDGFAIARALRQRVVVIGSNFGATSEAQQTVYNNNPAYNSILYLEHGVEDGTQYTDIYLDGSQGGVEAAHIKLNLTARCDSEGVAIGTEAADVNGVVRACGAIRKIHTMDLGSGDAAAQITIECDIYSYVQLYTKAGSADYFGHSDSGVLAIYHGFDFNAYSDFRLSGDAVAEIQGRNLYDLALGGVYNFIIDSSNRMKFIGGTTNPFGSYSGNHMKVKGDLDVGIGIYNEIRCTGDVVAFSTSDKTLKDEITPIEHPINKIKKLTGNTFIWNNKAGVTKRGKADIGVIAQEVQNVLPDATREQDGIISVRYEKIIPLLIEGIKDQQQQIDELKKRLEDSNE